MRRELAGTIGRIIARRRGALGITQEQLSAAIEVDPMTVSRFERGITLPSLLTVQRLAAVFGVTLGEFFDESPACERDTGDAEMIAVLLGSLDDAERAFIVDTVKRFCTLTARRPADGPIPSSRNAAQD